MKPNHFQTDQQDIKAFDPNDLDWLAFCYVADELDADQRHAFETRLENEQLARDAVANVVAETRRLDVALQTAASGNVAESKAGYQVESRSKAPSGSGISWQRALVLVTSTAALLVFVWIWNADSMNGNQPDNDDVAEVWSNEAWNSDFDPVMVAENFGDDVTEELANETERTEVTWLVAALEVDDSAYYPHEVDSQDLNDGGMPCIQ